MKLSLSREALLDPLQLVSGVVEKRQTLPILSNLLFSVTANNLSVTGSDQEVELSASTQLVDNDSSWEVTIPAKKLIDICKSLKPGVMVDLSLEENRVLMRSGRFKSHLATLPAIDFPKVEMEQHALEIELDSASLNQLLDKTAFAMAQQDVRYFFNGMLLEVGQDLIRAVATNGQRLALSEAELISNSDTSHKTFKQFIVPRKGIVELLKLIKDVKDETITLSFSANHLQVNIKHASMTTKLIDGVYPDYARAIPANGDKIVTVDRLELRESLVRIAILTHEMYRNVKLQLSAGELVLLANNPQHEDAEETLVLDYQGTGLEIGFNVSYLLDVLGTISGDKVQIELSDSKNAALITDPESPSSRFIVSPMML